MIFDIEAMFVLLFPDSGEKFTTLTVGFSVVSSSAAKPTMADGTISVAAKDRDEITFTFFFIDTLFLSGVLASARCCVDKIKNACI